jgi:hypothetical protein
VRIGTDAAAFGVLPGEAAAHPRDRSRKNRYRDLNHFLVLHTNCSALQR